MRNLWSFTVRVPGDQMEVLAELIRREANKGSRPLGTSTAEDEFGWFRGMNPLIEKGFVEERKEYVKSPIGVGRVLDYSRSGQFITARGRAIYEMALEDLSRFQPLLKGAAKQK